ESVAVSSQRPFLGFGSNVISISGKPAPTGEAGKVFGGEVSADYFRSVEGALLLGRKFDSRDGAAPEPGRMGNHRFVQEYFPFEDPIGRQIKIGLPDNPNPWLTIVGVVGDVQQTIVYKEMGYEVFPFVYRPMSQQSQQSMWLHVRANNLVNV